MISKSAVQQAVEAWLEGKEYFLVDVDVTPDDRIVVEIDHADGVWIEDCASLSRFIEDRLDRDDEDYELEVGSAGIGQPFKVEQQYINSIGKEIEVLMSDGKKLCGILKSVNIPDFVIATKEKMVPEGKKRPVLVDVDKQLNMNDIKWARYLLNFK